MGGWGSSALQIKTEGLLIEVLISSERSCLKTRQSRSESRKLSIKMKSGLWPHLRDKHVKILWGNEGGSFEHIFIVFFGALAQVNSKVSWLVAQCWALSLVTVAFTLLTEEESPPHTLKHVGANRISNHHSCNYQPGQPLPPRPLLLIPPSHSLSFLLTVSFCYPGIP